MKHTMVPARFRALGRLDTAGVSFGRSVLLGLGMAAFVLLITLMSGAATTDLMWYEVDLALLGPAEVLGALAAVTAGTIALQVMAQTAYSGQSRTLSEFNHRQNMGILALSSPAVSCTLAVSVWFDKDVKLPDGLPYLFVVLVIAAMNCFIAADAADRIIQVDDDNTDIRIAAARKTLSHYRRHRLPATQRTPTLRRLVIRTSHILVLSAAMGIIDALLSGAKDWNQGPGAYLAVVITTATIQVAASRTFVKVAGTDGADRWFSSLLLTFMSFTIFHLDPQNAWPHILTIVGLPTLLAVGSLITTDNRTKWLLPAWIPGTWPRESVSASIRKATEDTTKTLRELTNRKNEGPTLGAGKLQRLLLTSFSTLIRTQVHSRKQPK
jgi:hypothetical protein